MNEAALEDSELLHRYAAEGSEDAFAELVQRRIGLVYSVALRQTRGDRHRAEDATQAVFADLARKARSLAERPVLAGWLYRSAQFAATGLMRAEARRRVREQEAHTMENDSADDRAATDWDRVRPMLDEALNEIDERDRDAIVLRFFDGRPFAEIGRQFALTENAARMRVDRALDKLQASLARRGITSTTAALGIALGQQVTLAAPAGLAASVTGAALAQGAAGGGAIMTFLAMTKLQMTATAVVALAGLTAYVTQAQSNAALRAEIGTLRSSQSVIDALRAENKQLAAAAAEVELLRADDAEFKQLEQRVAEARQAQAERAKAARLAQSQSTDAQLQAEVNRMNQEGNKLVNEYKGLMERSKDPALSAEARELSAQAAQLKLEAIKAKQQQIKEFIAQAKLTNPGFTMPPAQVEAERRALAAQQERARAAGTGDVQFQPEASMSFGMSAADYESALSAYERIANVKIARDATLSGVQGTTDLDFGTASRNQIMDRMRAALRKQWNIVLERAPDGGLLAKRAPTP